MPKFGPIRRNDLIYYLKLLGFEGPHSGSKHEFMRGRGKKLILPNSHQGDLSQSLLASILRKAGITRDEWEKLK